MSIAHSGVRLIFRAHFNSTDATAVSAGRAARNIYYVYKQTWHTFTRPSPWFSRCHRGYVAVLGPKLRDVKAVDVSSMRASPAGLNGLPRSRCTDVGIDACGRTSVSSSSARNLSSTSTESSGRGLDNGFPHGSQQCEQTLHKTGVPMWIERSSGFGRFPSLGPNDSASD